MLRGVFAGFAGKVTKKYRILSKRTIKYLSIVAFVLVVTQMVFGVTAPNGALLAAARRAVAADTTVQTPEQPTPQTVNSHDVRRRATLQTSEDQEEMSPELMRGDYTSRIDSSELAPEWIHGEDAPYTVDTVPTQPKAAHKGSALEAPITGKNKDSLVFNVRDKMVYIYREGDVKYQSMNMKADFMAINMDTRQIRAYGINDTVDNEPTVTRPQFTEGGKTFTMDTIDYNMESGKAKIKGIATQEGDGYLVGKDVKKMADNTIHIADGMFTTCEHTDHPHFGLVMSKAKLIPGKKAIIGPSYIVMEDVPIYFLGLPEGFFPLNQGPKSGFIMPTYGEEYVKGFYLRDFGYYFTFNDYIDLTLKGGIYTLGSWEASASSRYIKRYKFSGNLAANYSKVRFGEKGAADYTNQGNFRIQWTHQQDPKFRPGSTFSASVNFSTSGYSKYSATSLNDILATQTNSSIAYSKSWAGTPFSMSANLAVSQNSQSKAISVTLPTVVVNMSRIYPFKRKEVMGKERWYEKISMSYTGKLTNSVQTTEKEIFTMQTIDKMRHGIEHSIPVSTSLTLFNYLNISPSANYTEKWYFKKQDRVWNPETQTVDYLEPEYGFYRLYNYNFAVSASTKLYGMFRFKNPKAKIKAIRHVITPSIGFSYAPDFSKQKYGYYKAVQSDTTGRIQIYSPFEGNAYGVPSSGRSAAINFSLKQNLEMKVASDRDTTGTRIIKLIDDLTLSGSYNFLADSMNLSNINVSFRTTITQNFGIQLSATLDPYQVTPEGRRINKFAVAKGKLGRIISTGWSFGYSFQSKNKGSSGVKQNDITSQPIDPAYANPFSDPYGTMDPMMRRMYMANSYYDFALPWNFSFNYTISYGTSLINNGTTGIKRNITQTLGFNGSLNLTPKWGVTFQGGFDLMTGKLTTSSISISRDLHCWQMGFSWIPFGYHKSWSFHIGVKSAMLQDLKYDKSQSMYDNLY